MEHFSEKKDKRGEEPRQNDVHIQTEPYQIPIL